MSHVFLDEHPDLQPFLLTNARPTGKTIGFGSYGSVEEVELHGAICAAKKIHDFFQNPGEMTEDDIERASREFVRECKLLSTLRYPHIVQFLGIYFFHGSQTPALVMERIMVSLHDILDPKTEQDKTYVPMFLKTSILHNVASGISFLHNQSQPIIHRDLSAKNVLLSEGGEAKIADLGMARILPSLKAATMTKAPGASIYMPPEALEDESRYNATIDIFSIGVLAIFLLSETFPSPLGATYTDEQRQIVGRTELERRESYMRKISAKLREDHSLIVMIEQCLKNHPEDRPKIEGVLAFIAQAKDEPDDDSRYNVSKLVLLHTLKRRDEQIELRQQQNEIQKDQIELFEWRMNQQEKETASQRDHIESLYKQIWSLQGAHGGSRKDKREEPKQQWPQMGGSLRGQIFSQKSQLKSTTTSPMNPTLPVRKFVCVLFKRGYYAWDIANKDLITS